MTDGFEARFRAALCEFLVREGEPAAKVLGYETDTILDGYCETCEWERAVVCVRYVDADDNLHTYTYDGDFGALIREL